jgi:tetratricopeptide (TPR) repeat protein
MMKSETTTLCLAGLRHVAILLFCGFTACAQADEWESLVLEYDRLLHKDKPSLALQVAQQSLKVAESKSIDKTYRISESLVVCAHCASAIGDNAAALKYIDRCIALLNEHCRIDETLSRLDLANRLDELSFNTELAYAKLKGGGGLTDERRTRFMVVISNQHGGGRDLDQVDRDRRIDAAYKLWKVVPEAYLESGLIRVSKGDGIGAEAAFSKALECGELLWAQHSRHFVDAYLGLADSLVLQGKLAAGTAQVRHAAGLLESFADERKRLAAVLEVLASLYSKQGDEESAEESRRKAKAILEPPANEATSQSAESIEQVR